AGHSAQADATLINSPPAALVCSNSQFGWLTVVWFLPVRVGSDSQPKSASRATKLTAGATVPRQNEGPGINDPGPFGCLNQRALGRTRTCNLLIRSQVLYPLSYERKVVLFLPAEAPGFEPGMGGNPKPH
ncbi:MAG: hypothetical protein JWO79_2747, partial [Actinomycetia bacterium]|nr:hypothetical protein [Actinomycetes bacterium]